MRRNALARLLTLVGDAAERPPAEARTWLAEQLKHEPELRAEALAMLEAGMRDDAFLEARPARREGGEREIGGYKIERLLGEGGMGAVYLALQANPKRRVALKLLSSGLVTPRSLQRFRFEIRALAALRHPGVAQIYAAGVHAVEAGPVRRELPWFAMEYVPDARSIRAFCEQEQLTRRERLQLFCGVCEAIQHGHQRGVVHRDLKPDNILVDGAGQAKVIDFGVARIADGDALLTTIRTNRAEIAGTLPYMAPERLARPGAVDDVRGDVYALGVVLYELMTGERPIALDSTDFVTAARRVAETQPRRPSELVPRLKGDLEVILLKALAKDPARRYRSVEAFARDVGLYLDRRPIEARPPGTLYQLRLFARRHLPYVISAAAVLLVAIAAAIVSTSYAVESGKAERRAEAGRELADAQRARAERLLETHLNRTADTVARFVPRISVMAEGPPVARQLVERIQEDLEALAQLAEGETRAQYLMALALGRLADVQGGPAFANERKYEEAEVGYRRALEILVELEPYEAELTGLRKAEADIGRRLVRVLLYRKDLSGAEVVLRRAEQHAELMPESALDRGLVRARLSRTWVAVHMGRGAYGNAIEAATRAIDVHKQALATTEGSRFGKASGIAWCYATIADCHMFAGRHGEAFDAYRAGYTTLEATQEAAVARHTWRTQLFEMHSGAAGAALARGELAAAKREGESSVRHLRTLIQEAPDDPRRTPRALGLFSLLADLCEFRARDAKEESLVRANLEQACSYLQEGIDMVEGSKSKSAAYFAASYRQRIERIEAQLAE